MFHDGYSPDIQRLHSVGTGHTHTLSAAVQRCEPWAIVWFEHLFLIVVMSYWVLPLWRNKAVDLRAVLAFLVVGGLGSALSTVAFTNAFH